LFRYRVAKSISAKEENLSGNVVLKINNAGLFAESGSFKITKYTKNKVIEGEINAEFSNFVDNKASLKNCTFSMKY
jgi:lipopolysaccharide export system protein LptA